MSPETIAATLTRQLEAAKKLAEEKRRHFIAARPLITTVGAYQAYLVAAAAYASAANDVEELAAQWEEAIAEAQLEVLRREAERQPHLFDNEAPIDVQMNNRALEGDEEAMRWVYENLK